jgi:predicted nucleic acid-binding protein
MAFVVDASVAASWAFSDEGHPVAAKALNQLRVEPAQVPSLWWFEVRNTLVANERRGRISEADTAAFLLDVGRLAIVFDRSPEDSTTLALARRHRLTVYDASYLELALRLGLPLAALDRELREAAAASGVALFGEAAA